MDVDAWKGSLRDSQDHQVIAVDHLGTSGRALPKRSRAEADQPARPFAPVRTTDPDHVLGFELAFEEDDARSEQAAPMLGQCADRTFVDVQGALRVVVERDPSLPAWKLPGDREKECPLRLSREDPGQAIVAAPRPRSLTWRRSPGCWKARWMRVTWRRCRSG